MENYGGYVKLVAGGRCCLFTKSELANGFKRFHNYVAEMKKKKKKK